MTLKLGFWITQGHQNWQYSIEHKHHRFWDIAAYWSKIATPLYLVPTFGVTPSDLQSDPWWRKTRMMGLSDGERISMIRSAVLIQYTRVTDRRTNGQTELAWHIRAITYMLSRVKIKENMQNLYIPKQTPRDLMISYGYYIYTVEVNTDHRRRVSGAWGRAKPPKSPANQVWLSSEMLSC